MVAAKIAPFAFHATLLVTLARVTKLRGISPMRPERYKPLRLLTLMATQDLLYRRGQVIVSQQAKYSAKVGERQFVRLKKGLLTCMRVGAVKRSAASHASHAEHIDLLLFTIELRIGFIPVHLCLFTPSVRLGDEDLASCQPDLKLALAHVLANRRFAHIHTGHLLTQAAPDPMSRMPLFARNSFIRFKNRIYE